MNNAIAYVFKKGILAATLSKKANAVSFAYDLKYLYSGRPAVASTLPLQSEPRFFTNGAAPAFFSGLLPEGRRLNALVDRIKTSASDDLGVLLEIGADLIGDVQVLAEGVNPADEREALMLPDDTSAVSFRDLRDEYFGARATGIPGVQDKVSSKMLNARARLANMDYILKFNPNDVPYAVENEFFFLELAKQCEIQTAAHKLLKDKNGDAALLLQRFDRVASKEGKSRLAQEDGCQALDLYPSEKYNVDFIEMANRLISLCPARSVAGYSLFKQLVFNWLIGNGDAHAKNFSVLEGASGDYQISPAYDLLCTRFYDDRSMALKLNNTDVGWSREDLLAAAEALRVPRKAAEKVIAKQLSVLRDLPEKILDGALPFRRHENIQVAEFLKKRARALA